MNVSILIFNSCNNVTTSFNDWLQQNFNKSIYLNSLEERFSKNDEFNICYNQFKYFDTLSFFYKSRNYKPVWTNNIVFNNNIDTVLLFFGNAINHGLDSNSFDAGIIRYYKTLFIQKAKFDSIIDYKELATLELLISNAVLTYSNTMQKGKTYPCQLFPKSYFLPVNKIDSGSFLMPLKVLDIGMYLRDIQPCSFRYVALQKSLKEYRDIELFNAWDSIIYKGEEIKIEIGDTSELLIPIAKRLMITNELDTSYKDTVFSVYDSILFKAVVKFQKNQGLLSDGVIGKRTIKQLNVSAKDRAKQICINLERFRWNSYPDTGKYVMINIPSYYLYAVDRQKKMLNIRVCVGSKRERNYNEKLKRYIKTKNKKLKPNNHETPCMYGKLAYFVINPKWLVPKSIGEKEIIYKLIKDSLYLKTQDIKVLLDGEELNPDSINWEKYLDRSLPFRFRQQPGEMNALGKLKFIFKNKFDIYLHDTPSKTKFLSSYRAVSHGCIRIHKPLDFVGFLLKNDKKLELDDIRMKLGMKPIDDSDEKKFKKRLKKYKEQKKEVEGMDEPPPLETKSIFLKENINVYIDYFTAWTDSMGVTQFRQDVYNKDRLILHSLNK